jgi:hypothetical protein
MGIASIANVPDSVDSTETWAFNHMAHHRDINRVIYQLFKIALPEYSLDPFNPNDFGVFGYQHQTMHNNQNAVLGIAGQDLTDVDWKDLGQRTVWIQLNFNEHYQASNILGV